MAAPRDIHYPQRIAVPNPLFRAKKRGRKINLELTTKEYRQLLNDLEELELFVRSTPLRNPVNRPFHLNRPSKKLNAPARELFGFHPSSRSARISRTSKPDYEKKKAVFDLCKDPRPVNCRKLSGREGWRLRVGHYRVIYSIDDGTRAVTALQVGHRRDIYR
jgi:mRNA interferase RelE/StbE